MLYVGRLHNGTQHKFRPSEPPMAAFRMQEMGQTGMGSTEHGDSSGDLFWMPYPDPFLT